MSDNILHRLIDDMREAAPEIKKHASAHRRTIMMMLLGVVIAIGSTGLLLGALTTGLASLVMQMGVPMVPAMNIGFFTVGVLALITGLFLAWAAWKALLRGSGVR